jgi:hypothetical protein
MSSTGRDTPVCCGKSQVGHRTKSTLASDAELRTPTGSHAQYEFESPNIILIRRQAFPAALSASLNFGDPIPSFPRKDDACTAANACCSYKRFNSSPCSAPTILRVMIHLRENNTKFVECECTSLTFALRATDERQIRPCVSCVPDEIEAKTHKRRPESRL